MKKILTILSVFLCVALMFTGCKKQVVSKKTLTFSNTQWGMTKEEVCKALKVPEDKLKLESSESKLECEEFILENYKYDKVPCDLILSFSNEDKTLYHVKLLFKGVKDVSQYKESVMKSVTKDLGNIPLTTILLTIPNEPEGKYYGSVWFNGSYDANLRSMDTK